MTVPRNAMLAVGGPTTTQMFGIRTGDSVFDAGLRIVNQRNLGLGRTAENVSTGFTGGVMFGLLDKLEAGALFLPLTFSPDLGLSQVPVVVTYHESFGAVDVGLRLGFLMGTPYTLNPGIPLLIRLGRARIDTGFFLPIRFQACPANAVSETGEGSRCQGLQTKENRIGIHVPLRVGFNATPRFFAGLETALAHADYSTRHNGAIALGAFAGYTLPTGATLSEITASINWDNFVLLNPAPGIDAVNPASFRVGIGFNWLKRVL